MQSPQMPYVSRGRSKVSAESDRRGVRQGWFTWAREHKEAGDRKAVFGLGAFVYTDGGRNF
jgi:hypothetical protein